MMVAGADPGAARVRPHVAHAVARTRHVLLDFDGVMFNVRDALGPDTREQAVTALLLNRQHRPRPLNITFAFDGIHPTMAFLAQHEPDNAAEAEAAVSTLELDAALTARAAPGLHQFLAACAAAGRKIAVISDLSEPAVLATLQARSLYPHIAAVAARQGLDLSTFGAACTAERSADLLGTAVTGCLLVSGNAMTLRAARRIGAVGMGCECGRDRRKHLAAEAPVVSGLPLLSQALLS